MPEHIHLLMSEPNAGNPSEVMAVLKQRVSRALRRKRKRAHAGQIHLWNEPPLGRYARFWQRRFYDFNVWSVKKKNEKMNYMHFNPVKRGLVERPRDWTWSSYNFYWSGEKGLCAPNPAWECKTWRRGGKTRTLCEDRKRYGTLGSTVNLSRDPVWVLVLKLRLDAPPAEVEVTCDNVSFLKDGQIIATHDISTLGADEVRVTVHARNLSTDALAGLSALTTSAVLEGEHLSITALSSDTLPGIFRYLAASGADVHSFVPEKLSLEDVFVRIMGEDRGL